jgi:hypothetical protein
MKKKIGKGKTKHIKIRIEIERPKRSKDSTRHGIK